MSATSADLEDIIQASISCELVRGSATLQCHRKSLGLSWQFPDAAFISLTPLCPPIEATAP